MTTPLVTHRSNSIDPARLCTVSQLPRRAYYLFLVRGGMALALAVALLFAGSSGSRIVTFVGVYWIVAAVITLRWVGAHRFAGGRRLGLLAGATGLAAGVAVALHGPLVGLLGEELLLDLLGLSAVATGLLRLFGRFHDDQLAVERPRRRYRIVAGSLDVVLGVALRTTDVHSAADVRNALGEWGLATGTLLLMDALVLRRLTQTGPPRAAS